MHVTEIRRLMPPDEDLPSDRLQAIREQVMTSIRGEVADHQVEARPARRRRRKLVPVLASALVLMAATTAGALGALPWQDREILDEAGCRAPESIEQLVAESIAPDGRSQQLWVTRHDTSSAPNGHILVWLNAQGGREGSIIGCSPPGEEPGDYYNGTWVSVPGEITDNGATASVIGHVSSGASTAVVTFDDGTLTTVHVQTDGFFLEIVSRPDITGDADLPEPLSLVAHDAAGNVTEETPLS